MHKNNNKSSSPKLHKFKQPQTTTRLKKQRTANVAKTVLTSPTTPTATTINTPSIINHNNHQQQQQHGKHSFNTKTTTTTTTTTTIRFDALNSVQLCSNSQCDPKIYYYQHNQQQHPQYYPSITTSTKACIPCSNQQRLFSAITSPKASIPATTINNNSLSWLPKSTKHFLVTTAKRTLTSGPNKQK
jgi:hypothetical protein